jgi:hypothetical protein
MACRKEIRTGGSWEITEKMWGRKFDEFMSMNT